MPARTNALPIGAAAAYLVAAAAAWAVGFRFWIPWAVVQLLDPVELERAPLVSLLALHSQPPALNTVLAGAVRLGALFGAGPEPLLSPLFFLLGGAVVVLLALLVRALTGSPWLAFAAALLAAADPALHVYRTVYYYELPLAALLLAALLAAWRFLAGGRERHLVLFVLAIGGMSLLRSLYHPVWAAAMLGLLLAGRARLAAGAADLPPPSRRAGRSAWLRAAVLLAVLLAAWPLKNALLFGAPVASTWAGYNLSRGTPVEHPALWAYIESGAVAPPLAREWERRAPASLRATPVVAAPVKSTGNRNWNHYAFLLTYRELAREAIAWRREHPRAWLRQGLANYLLWGRPSYLDSYWERPRGPDHPLYAGYAHWHQRLLFPDLRALVVRLSPGAAVHAQTVVWGGPAAYTLFAAVVLPLLLGTLAVVLPRRLSTRPEAWVALLAAAALLWVLAVPCLTDGTEGNRMRYPVSACAVLLAAWIAGGVVRRPRGARSRSTGTEFRSAGTDPASSGSAAGGAAPKVRH